MTVRSLCSIIACALLTAGLCSGIPLNTTGTILLRIRCPVTTSDCHLPKGICYSQFKVCAEDNLARSCSKVPALQNTMSNCPKDERKILRSLEIPINKSVTRLTVTVEATKYFILSKQEPIIETFQLLPGLGSVPNASTPGEGNWTLLTVPGKSQLLFDLTAVLQCRHDHFGPQCNIVGRPDASRSTTVITTVIPTTIASSSPTSTASSPQTVQIQNLCQLLLCQNKGKCFIGEALTPKCNCSEGWSGKWCQTRDPCYRVTCENGGSCQVRNDRGYCECPTQWRGARCERRDHCASLPCLNGATCTNGDTDYKCHCPLFYMGNNCEAALQQSKSVDTNLIIILVAIFGAGFFCFLIVIALFFVCRRSSEPVYKAQPAPTLEGELYLRNRARSSAGYDKVESVGNCYSEGSFDEYEEMDVGVEAVYIHESRPPLPPRHTRVESEVIY